ncbi:hypothetical protein AF335_19220 [Streptomyces eurocidicus]|uniref:Tyr recombinase domain-containing protein n=1 Tax=Streptomyces eurocidicus TaxID=66423 RepID=A0A2N8NV94_STREU|nr:hypothetical protein AF335_19220 [Streptomyces eurocidicus]
MEIPRKGRTNTWGVRTPRHVDPATGKEARYWIGRDFKNKTTAATALRKWFDEHEKAVEKAKEAAVEGASGGKAGVPGTVSLVKQDPLKSPDLTVGKLLDVWLKHHQGEGTTTSGYEPKIRLHIKPHLGDALAMEVTDTELDGLYAHLRTAPCPTNDDKPLGPKTVRHVHNMLSAAFSLITGPRKLLQFNPCHDAHPPTERMIKAAEPDFPTLTDSETARVLKEIWTPCGSSRCDGMRHHCLRDAALWSSYAVTQNRRSEPLGWMWPLIDWNVGSIKLKWVVVEEGNSFRLRKLTKDGDDEAIIYVDAAFLSVLWWQYERQQYEKERLGDRWVDHGLVHARDGFKLQPGRLAGGPQDPEKVSARWRTARSRLHLPEDFRLHDWRATGINNALDAKENPVEVSANARHHSVGYTLDRYGRRRAEGAKKLAASSASRIGLARATPVGSPALALSA